MKKISLVLLLLLSIFVKSSAEQVSSCYTKADACGGAFCEATAIFNHNQGDDWFLVQLNMDSNGHCGGRAPTQNQIKVPMGGYSAQVYSLDDTGCGGGNWDIGGYVNLFGNCEEFWCHYTLSATAKHDGVGSQCREKKSLDCIISFERPSVSIIK